MRQSGAGNVDLRYSAACLQFVFMNLEAAMFPHPPHRPHTVAMGAESEPDSWKWVAQQVRGDFPGRN